jgi:hypothetical protein
MPGLGTLEIDFGSAPGSSVATGTVTGQASIGASDHVEAWFMADSTAGATGHNAEEHKLFSRLIGRTCGPVSVGNGFPIMLESELRLTGLVKVHWGWSA